LGKRVKTQDKTKAFCHHQMMLYLCFAMVLSLYLVHEVVLYWKALKTLSKKESEDLLALLSLYFVHEVVLYWKALETLSKKESEDLLALQRLIKRERCRHRDEMIEQQYEMTRRTGVNQSLTSSGL
jgi:hypothetical protein